MAQWASSQDDEQQQGVGATNTAILKNGPSSNAEVPHPLMDCGQGKSNNIVNNDPAAGRYSDEVGGDVASGQEGRQVGTASDGEEDATGNDSAEDVPIAIAGVNYPIAGVPHPINKSVRLRKCESIPPPHGATPPLGGQRTASGSRYQNRHLTVPPHCRVVQIIRVASANVSRYHNRTVQSHL